MTSGEPALQIRLFGRPRLHFNGEPFPLTVPGGTLSLLVYLLLRRDAPLTRAALAGALWPDVADAHARATLRDHLRHLRVALPADEGKSWLATSRSTVQWNPAAPVRLDIADFDRHAREPAEAYKAAELYLGELASGLDDEWLSPVRAAYNARQRQLLLDCLSAARAMADRERALTYARRLLAHDAWCEDAVRALMDVLDANGDRNGALHAYRAFSKRLRDELDVAPVPETVAVYERLLGGTDRERHNLPAAMTTFVGREPDQLRLENAIAERRLVTLSGPGGVGKTRLAVEAARAAIDRFADGVWIVELAQSFDAGSLVSMIATALRLQSTSEDSLFAMLRHKQLLLVLDNCEHLIDAVAIIVDRILGNCAHVHIVATSREPLRVSGERLERIDVLSPGAAVQLFRDRLADVSPHAVVSDNASTENVLRTIAGKLDGIPLAIELAAARAGSLGLPALMQRLDDRFALLTSGKRAAVPHQQTLRATIDWSFELLGRDEQHTLVQLGTFSGGWTLDAATAVCADGSIAPNALPALLATLVDKSLVSVDLRGSEPRYRLLETTRAYARERISTAAAGDAERRQAAYYSDLAHRHDATWVGGFTGASADLLTAELENFRSVLSWSIEGGNDRALGTALVGSLRWFFAFRLLNSEGVRWCELALAAFGTGPAPDQEGTVQLALAGTMGAEPFFPRFHFFRAEHAQRYSTAALRAADLLRGSEHRRERALAFALAALHLRLAERQREAEETAEHAVASAHESGNAVAVSLALYAKSYAIDPKNTALRKTLLIEALHAVRSTRGPYNRATALHALGEVAFEAGDASEALTFAQDAVRSYDGFASPFNLAQVQINVAAYALQLGQIATARDAARAALTVAQRAGDPMIAAAALQHLAGIAIADDDATQCAQLLGASDAHRSAGPPRLFTEQSGYDRTRRAVSAVLSERTLQRALRQGRELSADRNAQWSFEQTERI